LKGLALGGLMLRGRGGKVDGGESATRGVMVRLGMNVMVIGLKTKQEYNQQYGVVKELIGEERVRVVLQAGPELSIKCGNAIPLPFWLPGGERRNSLRTQL